MPLVYAVDETVLERRTRRQQGDALQPVSFLLIDDKPRFAPEPQALPAVLEHGGNLRAPERFSVFLGGNGSECLLQGVKAYHSAQSAYPVFAVAGGYDSVDAFRRYPRRIGNGERLDTAGGAVQYADAACMHADIHFILPFVYVNRLYIVGAQAVFPGIVGEGIVPGIVEVDAAAVRPNPQIVFAVFHDTVYDVVVQRVAVRYGLYLLKAVFQGVVVVQASEKCSQPYAALRVGEDTANGGLRQAALSQGIAFVYPERAALPLVYVE